MENHRGLVKLWLLMNYGSLSSGGERHVPSVSSQASFCFKDRK